MPKIDAVSNRNCATTVQFPAATSCSSEMASETNANTTAAIKLRSATEYSSLRLFGISIKS